MGSRGWDILKGLWRWFTEPGVQGARGSLIPWLWVAFIAALIIGAVILLTSCASADFDYHWMKTRPAAPKPWLTVEVIDPDFTCRSLGADAAHQIGRIGGCAQWHPINGCIIYVPHNAPEFILEHEKKHCEGWTHG